MSKEASRDQLKQCFIDLGERAGELNEPYIYSVCLMLAASISERSDAEFCSWCALFAQARVDQIREDIKKLEER